MKGCCHPLREHGDLDRSFTAISLQNRDGRESGPWSHLAGLTLDTYCVYIGM